MNEREWRSVGPATGGFLGLGVVSFDAAGGDFVAKEMDLIWNNLVFFGEQ